MLTQPEIASTGFVRHQQLDVLVREERGQPAGQCRDEALRRAGITVGLSHCPEQSSNPLLLLERRSFCRFPLSRNPPQHRCDLLSHALDQHSFHRTVSVALQVGDEE
jgi:hypothetical protein